MDSMALHRAVLDRLKTVIDPETGADVIRMQLVRDINVDDAGKVTYIFRPSSPLCPIAVPLAVMIIQAIGEVEGVTAQRITVVDYIQADRLNEILSSVLES